MKGICGVEIGGGINDFCGDWMKGIWLIVYEVFDYCVMFGNLGVVVKYVCYVIKWCEIDFYDFGVYIVK